MAEYSLSPPTSPIFSPAKTALTLSRTLARLNSKLTALQLASQTSEFLPERYELRKLFSHLHHAQALLHQLESSVERRPTTDSSFVLNTEVVKNLVTGNHGMDVEKELRLREDLVRWKGELRDMEDRLFDMDKRRREATNETESDSDHNQIGIDGHGSFHMETKETLESPLDLEKQKVQQHSLDPPPTESNSIAEEAVSTPAPFKMPALAITPTGLLPLPSPSLSFPHLRHRFGPLTPKTPPTTSINTEVVLDHVRQEQDNMTDELLQMAKQLKESSIEFGKDLEEEKPLIESAILGLDKNVLGMETTGGRVKQLRKYQNVGFMWRMIYLAVGVALMLAILLVLTLPKLR
ncbi:hypothetical protein BJ508DRAFT_303171 [Ascobolus immersus RN42]|uniref:Synaptobrevin n=1 Tax=Ascobolus immersus RN42 TaxID=1160509 RepID=A0A3N4IG53_ASCIM|nr:hypothetical protein BJ508DRAFT_303171 [Ascobolus immersus RN42]